MANISLINGNDLFDSGVPLSGITGSSITLTTTGSTGVSTLIGSNLNIPNYTTDISGLVPYTGATQDVNLGEFGVQLGNLEFDLTPTNIPTTVGSMVWNDSDGTLDLKLKGGNVTLQIGQETVARVVNKTATNITLLESNYQVVRVTGAQGQRPKVDLALADNDLNSTTTLGLVTETILNNQEGFITTSGQVRAIDTTGSLQGETWNDGDVLYLSGTIPGAITNIKPIAPVHTVILGFVEYSHAINGKIFVKVDNGYELEELHNVSAISPNNNEVLTYDTPTLLWKPKSITDIITLTTTGTTGPSTFSTGGTLNIPQYEGGGGSSQWTTTGTSIYYTNNVLVGKTSDAGFKLDVLGTSNFDGQIIFEGQSTDSGQLGSQLLTTGSGSNWAGTSYTLGYTHTTGSVVALTSTFQPLTNNYYQVILTISNRTAGSVTVTLGGTSVISSATLGGTYYIRTISTAALVTTPTTTFDGKVVISVKLNSVGTPSIIFNNNTPTVISEMRNTIATNHFFGKDSGGRFISGINNLTFGSGTLQNFITGDNNIAVGFQSLNLNIGGGTNIGIEYIYSPGNH